jgi:hypothetical protein
MLAFFGLAPPSLDLADVQAVKKKKPKKKGKKIAGKTGGAAASSATPLEPASLHAGQANADDSEDSDDDIDAALGKISGGVERKESAMVSEFAYNNMKHDPATLTVQEVLRIRGGEWSERDVAACVQRMFDLNLAYDDVQAVISELSKAQQPTPEVPPPAPKPQPAVLTAVPPVPAPIPVPFTTPAPAPAPVPVATKSSAPLAAQQPSAPASAPSSSSPRNSKSSSSGTSAGADPSRLELAAAHPDVLEGIAALCAWASLVSAPASDSASASVSEQLEQFLREKACSDEFFSSQALEILLQSLFRNPQLMQQTEVRSQLGSLLQNLIPFPESQAQQLGLLLSRLDLLVAYVGSLKSGAAAASPASSSAEAVDLLESALASSVARSIRNMRDCLLAADESSMRQREQKERLAQLGSGPIAALVEGTDNEIAQIRAEVDLTSGGSGRGAVEGKVDLAALFRQREASLDVTALQAKCVDDLGAAEERLKDALRSPHSHNTALDGQAQRSSQTLLSTAAAIVSSPVEVAALQARVLSLFGESSASLDRKQGQTNQVYQFLETLTRQRDAACRPNLLEIEDLDIKRDQMQRQRALLLQQLQALDASIGAIDARKETLQAAVAAAQSSYQQQTGSCPLPLSLSPSLRPFFAPSPTPISTKSTTQLNNAPYQSRCSALMPTFSPSRPAETRPTRQQTWCAG